MIKILRYLKTSFILELKKTLVYPTSFWIVALTIPLYSLIQIVFLESIYSQTTNFVGYTKYEAYILFGTYTIVQTLGHLIFYNRLSELKGMINGGSQESFDMALTKPIDTQVFATIGRFNFGNIAPLFVSSIIVLYGLFHEYHLLGIINIASYLFSIIMGITIFYLTFLFISTFLFWSPELQITEDLGDSILDFGQFPSALYKGSMGILFNFVIPVTLMASVPVDFLLGKMSYLMFIVYSFILFLLFLLTRLFWNLSIKKYSSFSS